MKKVEIQLSSPTKVGDKEITMVVMREPTTGEFFELGEPILLTQTEGGTSVIVHNNDVIRKYIQRCMFEPSSRLDFIDSLPLTDAVRLKGAVLDFFTDARRDGSNQSENSSSANSSGSQEENSSS